MKTVLILISLLVAFSQAQKNYLFENISIPEGLSNPEVFYIYQDSRGFLWISTLDGLNRYDGYSVKVYKNDPGDPGSLPNNFVGAMIEDDEGYLWIGCFGSLIARFDPGTERFTTYEIERAGISDPSIFHYALKDAKGDIWFASSQNGIQKYDRQQDRFLFVALDSVASGQNWGEVFSIVELKNGNILAADYSNGIKIYNKEKQVFQAYYLKVNYSPDEIISICEMPSGEIWFGGNGKLLKYSPVYYTVEESDIYSGIKSRTNYDAINSIIADDDNHIWFSMYGKGMFKLDAKTGRAERFEYDLAKTNTLSSNRISQIYRDKFGIFWVGNEMTGLDKFDPLREPFYFHKIKSGAQGNAAANAVTCISGSPTATEILIGTSSEGIYRFDLVSREYQPLKISYPGINNQLDNINITGLVNGKDGDIWFGFNSRLLNRYNKNGIITPYSSPSVGKTAGFLLNAMKMDLSGHIWMASRYGVETFDPVTKEFSSLPRIMSRQLHPELNKNLHQIVSHKTPLAEILKAGEAANVEKSFTLESDTRVLIMCMGEGRLVQGNDGVFDYGLLRNNKANILWSMKDMSKTFHAGGGYKNRLALGVMELKKGEYRLNFVSDVGHSYGNWNTEVPPDSNWWGIQVLELDESEFKMLSSQYEQALQQPGYMSFEIGTSIEFSKRYYNVVWIGTARNSFFRYDKSTGEFKKYNYDSKNQFSSENVINTLLEDREGILWVGTPANLLRFDPETEKVERFNMQNGLPGNLINSLVEDLQGNLWISTPAGMSKLNKNAPREKWNFVNFDARDGLQGYSNARVSWLSGDGEVYFGGNEGLNSFFPGKINTFAPSIVIEDIKISDVSIKTDSSLVSGKENVFEIGNIELSHTQNDISFNIAAIHFSRPAKNKIAYKLEGFNSNWVNTDHNYVSFTNLDPGQYVFRVKGANGDGIWNNEGRALHITIAPPWWQTNMAYAGYVGGFVLLIFGIDRFQRRRILQRAKSASAIREAELRAQLAEAENERKSKELEEARQLQLSMLPRELPALPNLDIAVYMKTATEVGGDYYDFHVSMDGALTVVIGDATGHGMKAGTMVTTAKSLFNSYAPNPDILYSFHEITRCIKQMNLGKLSMCLTMLKISGNKMQVSAAGMPPVFIFRREDQTVEEHLIKGMPLGTMEKFPYEITETTLQPGDTILMISDGLPELQNDKQDMYGYKRVRNAFEEVAEKAPEEIVDYLKNAGSAWVADRDPDDDVTFVVLKMK